MHNFAWAIEELKAGRKVRRAGWYNKSYIFRELNNTIAFCIRPGDYTSYEALSRDIFAEDWESRA